MPNLSENVEISRKKFVKMPLEEKLKLYDLQRRKMSSSFGLTTTKMKQLLSKLKKKFVIVPRVNSYKLIGQT